MKAETKNPHVCRATCRATARPDQAAEQRIAESVISVDDVVSMINGDEYGWFDYGFSNPSFRVKRPLQYETIPPVPVLVRHRLRCAFRCAAQDANRCINSDAARLRSKCR